MRRTLIRRTIAAVCVVASLAMTAAPAQAAWSEPFGKVGFMDRFTYAGAIWNTKSFYLIDRIGNGFQSTAMHQGLSRFVTQWNLELQNRGLYGILPAIAYVRDDAGAGQCSNGQWDGAPVPMAQAPGAEYSYILACAGAPTGGMGVARGSTQSRRLIRDVRIFPYAYCSSLTNGHTGSTMTVDQYRSCYAHEVGHLMGVPHDGTTGRLMNTDGSGILASAWFPSDVWQKLLDLYPEMWQD